jgi:hypothetical protein
VKEVEIAVVGPNKNPSSRFWRDVYNLKEIYEVSVEPAASSLYPEGGRVQSSETLVHFYQATRYNIKIISCPLPQSRKPYILFVGLFYMSMLYVVGSTGYVAVNVKMIGE